LKRKDSILGENNPGVQGKGAWEGLGGYLGDGFFVDIE